ncbi:MAG TPA: radical SAM protein [Thermoanaerobaculia bacterium]
MGSFRRVAIVQSHQQLGSVHAYYVPDLVELCGLAAFIRDEVDQVDLPVSPSDREPLATFERYLRRNRPDLVGISAFTCGANAARQYARLASEMGAYVVAGGFHPSALPEEVLDWPGVEAVVRGEGEHALRELIRTGSPHSIPGFSYRTDGEFVHNPVPPAIEDLDSLPLPARELRPERFGLSGLDYHTDTVYASRGCRGRCRFCANDLIGRNWRVRSNELILRELLTLTPPRKGPWKYIKFWDSNFLGETERIDDLCHMILSEGLQRHFRFIVESRVEDIVRAGPILKTMRKAGFVRIGCGVESPNRKTHNGLRKGINLDHVATAAKLVADSNIQFTKFLIVGHPHESREDILAYPEFALSHGKKLQKTTIFVMTPYPGTDLGAEYAQSGRVKSFDWDLYNNHGAVVAPGDIGSLELQSLFFAVAAAIAVSVRLQSGRPLVQAAARILEPLFVSVKMARLRDRFSRHDLLMQLMDRLERFPVPEDWSRPARPRLRFLDRLALRFHAPGHDSVVFGMVEDDGSDRLVTRIGEERLRSRGKPLREVHISLPLIVELIERLDNNEIAHDATLLRWKPLAYRLRWIPSLLKHLGVATLALLRLTAFHLRHSIWNQRSSGTQIKDGKAPQTSG